MGALVDVTKAVLELRGCKVTEITQRAYDFEQRRFHVSCNGKEATMTIQNRDVDVRPDLRKVLKDLGLEPQKFVQMELPL